MPPPFLQGIPGAEPEPEGHASANHPPIQAVELQPQHLGEVGGDIVWDFDYVFGLGVSVGSLILKISPLRATIPLNHLLARLALN